jgi:hypothetical protein
MEWEDTIPINRVVNTLPGKYRGNGPFCIDKRYKNIDRSFLSSLVIIKATV